MSQTPQSTTFDMFNSKPGLTWADEMNELAEAEEIGTLPTLPAWTPLQELSSTEEHGSHAAQVDNSTTSPPNSLNSNNIYAKNHAEGFLAESRVEGVDSGAGLAIEDGSEENTGGPTDDYKEPQQENEQQLFLDYGTFSCRENEAGSSEEMPPSTGSFPSEEADYTDKFNSSEQEQSPENCTISSDNYEFGIHSSEQRGCASSASDDDYDPTFAPYHPGWTKLLSPSISQHHSTPPEVNKWAFSAPIGLSLQQDLDSARLDEDCPNLARPATVFRALLCTDADGFIGYAFPYGARGLKRPLPPLFPRRRRSQVGQRSRLWHAEVAEYSQEDLRCIEINFSDQMRNFSAGSEKESKTVENDLVATLVQAPTMHGDSSEDTEDGDDLWSPEVVDEDDGSNSSIEQDDFVEADVLLPKKGGRSSCSVSEPDLETYNNFDLDDVDDHDFRFVDIPHYLTYLDLSIACAPGWKNVRIEQYDKQQSSPDIYEGSSNSFEVEDAARESCAGSVDQAANSEIEVKSISGILNNDGNNELMEKDESNHILDLAIATTLPEDRLDDILDLAIATSLSEVDLEEDLAESDSEQLNIAAPTQNQANRTMELMQRAEGELARVEVTSGGLFGGIVAAGRFFWRCLNDQPFVLDNPW
ncbi:hypothetical protein IWZ03DRAFT_432749 [Phyllosticta citriasiana]|uniref:Uncharacterized protein n=1 Tax=Phyllosticta citriasiana TaxID=595635 RepID=A0ABR1KBY1_9PEZI